MTTVLDINPNLAWANDYLDTATRREFMVSTVSAALFVSCTQNNHTRTDTEATRVFVDDAGISS